MNGRIKVSSESAALTSSSADSAVGGRVRKFQQGRGGRRPLKAFQRQRGGSSR